MILNLLEELTGKYLIGAIPKGFSSTFCKLLYGVRYMLSPRIPTKLSAIPRTEKRMQTTPKTCTKPLAPAGERLLFG